MKLVYAVLLTLTLGACDTLSGVFGGADLSLLQKAAETGGKVEEATLGNAMKALPYYCKLPQAARATLRDHANSRPEAGGNKLAVHCVGDPTVTLP